MATLSIESLSGTLLVAAPHMDDEVLACGGLIARWPDPTRVHVVYATDGMRSPAPAGPWEGPASEDLGAVRRRESMQAMAVLGVPPTNLHFLNLPEAELAANPAVLEAGLRERMRAIDPDVILLPFRYDRHPDHLAVNRVVSSARRSGATRAELLEYFVYHRSRLLPRGDVRAYLRPECVVQVDISAVARRKREALDCFKTQTTRFYEWQSRPILQPALLDEECASAEQFLHYDPERPGAGVFSHGAAWILLVDRIELPLVRWKHVLRSWMTGAR